MPELRSTPGGVRDLLTSWAMGPFDGRLLKLGGWTNILTSWGMVPTLGVIISVLLARVIAGWVYNLYFHPLAWAPGPMLGRASLLYRFRHSNRGQFHLVVTEAHRKYGPIVRVAPNELSFASNEAWKAIYGHPPTGRGIAPKGPFYEAFAAGFNSKCVGSERDPPAHSRMRKMLNPAFSQRALLAQEKIISGVIDRFIQIVGEKAPGDSAGLNMSKWYEINSFDILGEMAFGESFHGLESGKPHFWADIVLEHLYFINLVDNLRRLGWVARFFGCLVPASLIRRNRNSQYSRRQVEKLLASGHSREDFASPLVQKVRAGEISKEEMAAHVSTITIAGGETVATTLTSLTCFLAQNPDKLGRVVSEIRQAFGTYESVKAQEAQRLPYLQAVISEGLRLFPPASGGAPRVSPGFALHGAFIPKGTEVNVNPWAVTHDPEYFHDPYAFLPERWLDPESTDLKEASRPFLLGPRDCLGRNFAMMELNLVLAKMLWTYDIELVNREIDWLREGKVFVLWWKPKLFVRFHKRAGKGAR